MDALLNMLCILVVQAVNNSSLTSQAAENDLAYEFSSLQSGAVVIKILILTILILECIIFILQKQLTRPSTQRMYIDECIIIIHSTNYSKVAIRLSFTFLGGGQVLIT